MAFDENVRAVGSGARRARVLVVEDAEAARELAVEALVDDGFDTVEAEDGSTALVLLREHSPDAMILDRGLPVVSGLDVLVTVRKESDLPVIIVSGRAEEGDRLQGLRLGADDYVVKPSSRASSPRACVRCCVDQNASVSTSCAMARWR